MTGVEMLLLKRRLEQTGLQAHQFRYRMMLHSLEHNIDQLENFVRTRSMDSVSLVGHSLGGVLALQTLLCYPDLPVDKVICLGSPLVDTAAGRRLQRLGPGRHLLGKTLPEAVFEQPLTEWQGSQPVGVVAGTRSFGVGKLVMRLPKPNDGVVTVAETCLPGITDHLSLPVSHFGLLTSRTVAGECARFLREDRFRHA